MYIIMLLKCNHIELAKSKEEMKAYRMYYQSYPSKQLTQYTYHNTGKILASLISQILHTLALSQKFIL